MIPTRRLVIIAAVLAMPLMLAGLNRSAADTALLLNLVLVAIACVDLLISPGPSDVEVRREISEVLSVGASNPATLILRNRAQGALTLTVHDDPGPLCEVDRLPQTINVGSGKEGTVHYIVKPHHRGASEMPAVHLRFPTRLGLWMRQIGRAHV